MHNYRGYLNIILNKIKSNTKFIYSILFIALCDYVYISNVVKYSNVTNNHLFIYQSFLYENSTSFGTTNYDTLVVLYVGDKINPSTDTSCVYSDHSTDKSILQNVPATVSKIDYVQLCQLVIHVLWCTLPPSINNNDRIYAIDFAKNYKPGNLLDTPIHTKISPVPANRQARQMVICMSRIFAFEKWQLFVTAIEVYRLLKVDLVVAHVNSVLTSIFQLMKQYEAEGILLLRPGIELPYVDHLNYDPNAELEYSGQLVLAHECFYEFRESAQFIALLDWDDLLITTTFPTLPAAFQSASLNHPNLAYFLVNKLESTFVEQDQDPTKFDLQKLIEKGVMTKYSYNSEKMVIRPDRVFGFWVHYTHSKSRKYHSVQMTTNYSVILHLARKIPKKDNEFKISYMSELNLRQLQINNRKFMQKTEMEQIMQKLPSELVYFNTISNCSKYINAFPTLDIGRSPCLSYSLCTYPKVQLSCTITDNRFVTKQIGKEPVYYAHVRKSSGFKQCYKGCFENI